MKNEGANGKNKETFPSKRGTSRRASRFFVGWRDDEREHRDAPKRTCEERVNWYERSRTRYTRVSALFCFSPSPLHRVSYLIHTQPDTGEDFSIEKVHLRHRASQEQLRMSWKGYIAQNDGEHKGERNGEGKRQNPSPL